MTRILGAGIGALFGAAVFVATITIIVLGASFMAWEWQGEMVTYDPPMLMRWASLHMVIGAVFGWLKTGGEG